MQIIICTQKSWEGMGTAVKAVGGGAGGEQATQCARSHAPHSPSQNG